MKRLMKRLKGIMLWLAVLVLVALPVQALAVEGANDEIKVTIDGEYLSMDVAPESVDGRTLVPMRAIFEALGANVQYWSDIYANRGELYMVMYTNEPKMWVCGKEIELDVKPLAKEGRYLVPLRVVSETLSAGVKWDAATKTVEIDTSTMSKVETHEALKFDPHHVRTSEGSYEYLDFVIDGNTLTIAGFVKDERVKKAKIFIEAENRTVKYDNLDMTVGEEASMNVNLEEIFADDDKVNINIWFDGEEESLGAYIYDRLYMEKTADGYEFQKPPAFDESMKNKPYDNPSRYLYGVGAYAYSGPRAEIVALSNEICEGAVDNYDKLVKIHDWVAENIYYDYDRFYGRASVTSGVFESRRGVCADYANLTNSLILAQNIPSHVVTGYALGLGEGGYSFTEETAKRKGSNHAWVLAYADNRWVTMDTTWDSANRYENGEYKYGGMGNHYYFDISDVFFSYSHKYN